MHSDSYNGEENQILHITSMFQVPLDLCIKFSISSYLKGGLSGRNDLTVFNCFRVMFSLKNQTIQFTFSFNHYFQQKRAPKLSICNLRTKSSV